MAGEMREIRWHGRGGQGAVTAAKLVAASALREGKYLQAFPEYGPERRGAPLKAYTRISDKPVRVYSQIRNPGLVVVLDPTLLTSPDVVQGVGAGTVLVANFPDSPERLRQVLGPRFASICTVDATRIALKHFGKAITNTPMVGALLRAAPVVRLESFIAELEEEFSGEFPAPVVEANLRAVQEAYESLRRETAAAGSRGKAQSQVEASATTEEGPGWRDIPIGALILDSPSGESYRTGDWRSERPIFDRNTCIDCFLCWIYCPDSAFRVEEGHIVAIDYFHCKGCGICAEECPVYAITMAEEGATSPNGQVAQKGG